MFCAHCGREMPTGVAFCPACGVAVPAEPQSYGGASPEGGWVGQVALPAGIVMDETGVLHWEYVQNMWTNPVHLYLLLKIFLPEKGMPFPPVFAYVPWGHHVLIITKCKDIEEAAFYLSKTVKEGLSRKALDDCIRADLYRTSGKAVTNYSDRLPMPQGKLALELTKGNYDITSKPTTGLRTSQPHRNS